MFSDLLVDEARGEATMMKAVSLVRVDMARDARTMKRLALLTCAILMVAIAAFADDDSRKCPSPAEECAKRIREMMTGQKFLGVIFYDSETGIFVKSVVDGSPADEAGMKAGDFIIAIEGRDISDGNVKAFKKIFGKSQARGEVTLKIRRGETTLTTTAYLREITEEQITRIIAAHMEAAHSDHRMTSTGLTSRP
jgi:predicted metalloprotease with PDZ domain